jgi:anti-sigma factor RsiW
MIRRLLERRRFMREHRWTHEHLSGYLDGELAASERHRVDEHVGLCPQCSRVLATLRRTLEGLHLLRAPVYPGVADSVIGRLRDEP